MLSKKPRPPIAFLSPFSLPISRSPPLYPRTTPKCAAVKLLVVDLPTLLQNASPESLQPFSQRVEVDRTASQNTTYLLYTTRFNYKKSMRSIRTANLVEPDALAALDGSELYQRRYRTPDPYWAKKVGSEWDPKPAAWVATTFFPQELVSIDDEDTAGGYELAYEVRGGDVTDVSCRVGNKLAEMGVKARVCLRGDRIVVAPAAGNVADVVAFCQMMLRIPEEATFVFGGEALVKSCVEEKANWGICGKEQGAWADGLENVFVSAMEGVDAVVEGVLHHAVF